MSKVEEAFKLVEQLALMPTPEEEFDERKGEDGTVEDDGVVYEDVDEMVADMSDERLCQEYGKFMDFVRAAKQIIGRPDDPA